MSAPRLRLSARWPVILLFLAQPALAADQFDLVCKGTEKDIGLDAYSNVVEKPYSGELRVDLKAMKYCEDECARTLPIQSATDEVIIFERTPASRDSGQDGVIHEVNRATGQYLSAVNSPPPSHSSLSVLGTCEPGPFKGFPTTPKKF